MMPYKYTKCFANLYHRTHVKDSKNNKYLLRRITLHEVFNFLRNKLESLYQAKNTSRMNHENCDNQLNLFMGGKHAGWWDAKLASNIMPHAFGMISPSNLSL